MKIYTGLDLRWGSNPVTTDFAKHFGRSPDSKSQLIQKVHNFSKSKKQLWIRTRYQRYSVKLPAETKATIIEVEVAEDWTATVTKIPIIIPTIGLLSSSEDWNNLDKFRPPKMRNDVLKNVKEQINKYKATRMPIVFKRGLATFWRIPRLWIFILFMFYEPVKEYIGIRNEWIMGVMDPGESFRAFFTDKNGPLDEHI